MKHDSKISATTLIPKRFFYLLTVFLTFFWIGCLLGSGTHSVSATETNDVDSNSIETDEAKVFEEPVLYNLNSLDLKSSEIGEVQDGGATENELFEFEAFIKETDIKDGTAPFDQNDEAGNDSNESNGIIRTFDTATYPIKITINPKKVDKLENIKLRITGYIENGVTDGRVNAKFSVGGRESIEGNEISFEQEYTITQTGNSVMIPVSINVLGAKNNVTLKPHLTVQVVSVDGEDISANKVITNFDNLPTLTTSGKVSIGAKINHISGTVDYLSKFIENIEDEYILNHAGVAFYAKNLPGKTDTRGATFPTGEIDFTIEVDGYVYWDKNKEKVPLDFQNKDTPVRLFDLLEITNAVSKYNRIGSKNTIMEGLKYYKGDGASGAPLSKMPLDSPKYHENSVWDSGEYVVEKVNTRNSNVSATDGTIKNYVIGSTFPVKYDYAPSGGYNNYGADQKVFSTRRIELATPTEYAVGGIHNKEGNTNNVYYTLKVRINSYEDEEGVSHSINEVSNNYTYFQRNGIGSISSSLKFWSESGVQLGTTVVSNGYAPMGDESVLRGTPNVQSRFRLANSNAVMQGGAITIIKWNTDSFELIRENANKLYFQYLQAKTRIWKSKDTGNVSIKYGVPKNTDMSFRKYLSYGINDYIWFDTYDEAAQTGKVGSVLFDTKDEIEIGPTILQGSVPLKILSNDTIGSVNESGTPNISTQLTYAYYDKSRKMEAKILDTRYQSFTTYDKNGAIIELQKPVGDDVSLDTLGIINGNVSNTIKSDKTTYYSSDTIGWNVKSSLIIPDTVSIENFNDSVFIEQVLPAGLIYKVNSALVGGKQVEPKITKNSNGTTSLMFEVLPSTKDMKIGDIYYETTVNPIELTMKDGVQANITVNSIISSEIDQRSAKFRTSSQTVNIIKVGMVGIYADLETVYGEKNSEYTIKLKPYTTIDEEKDVKGLTILPINGDKLGSKYEGEAYFTNIAVSGDKPVTIYLNKNVVDSKYPNRIDLTKDGWYKYTGKAEELRNAKTFLFHVEGILASSDQVEISYSVQTANNNFGNIYFNETVINSTTDYKLSPISNRLKFTIRADAELGLERIQIYTANADSKLPVRVRINKEVINNRSLTEGLSLVLYEKETNQKVYEKEFTIESLGRENELEIPSQFLEKNTNEAYEVRVEGYNTNRIYVKEAEDRLDTLGYTASEEVIEEVAANDVDLQYQGVVMTERKIGKEMETFYETITLPLKKLSPLKSGYGFGVDQEVHYTNDISVNNILPATMEVLLDSKLLDGNFYHIENGKGKVDLESEAELQNGSLIQKLKLPKVYVQSVSGNILSEQQYIELNNEGVEVDIISGGNKVYVPIWIDELGSYDYLLKNTAPIGVNEVNISVSDTVDVTAYMYGHIGSETIENDEILIVPVDLANPFPNGLPDGWTESDLEWLQGN